MVRVEPSGGADTGRQQNTERNGPSFLVVQCVHLLVNAPPIEVSDLIRVCRSHEKGWYLEARVDIPAGERVAVYPVTTKADPAWPTQHLTPDKVAQQSQYLMPVYAKSSRTNWEYKIKHLVGDVSQRSSMKGHLVWHTWQTKQCHKAR